MPHRKERVKQSGRHTLKHSSAYAKSGVFCGMCLFQNKTGDLCWDGRGVSGIARWNTK